MIRLKPFKYYRSRLNLLLLAIFLWLFVVTGREYEAATEIPLVVKNISSDKILISDLPDKVEVRFKGIGRSLIVLNTFFNPQYQLDLSAVKYYSEISLSATSVDVPSGLQIEPVEIINPTKVRITLDDRSEKELVITPSVSLEIRPGFVLVGDLTIEPDSVLVSGPRSVIKELKYLTTEERIYEDLHRNLDDEIGIHLPDTKLTPVLREVHLTAVIERLTEMDFRNISIAVRNPPKHYIVDLDPPSVSIKVSGAVSFIKNLTSDDITAEIDFPRRWNSEINSVIPIITLPEGVKLVNCQPDTIYVTLEER